MLHQVRLLGELPYILKSKYFASSEKHYLSNRCRRYRICNFIKCVFFLRSPIILLFYINPELVSEILEISFVKRIFWLSNSRSYEHKWPYIYTENFFYMIKKTLFFCLTPNKSFSWLFIWFMTEVLHLSE